MLKRIIRESKNLSLRELQKIIEYLEDEIQSRRNSQSENREVIEEKTVDSISYRLVKIRCGKKECRCLHGELHGPYWYSYQTENGKTKCRYVGKTLPDQESILRLSEKLRQRATQVRAKSSQAADNGKKARLGSRKALSSSLVL